MARDLSIKKVLVIGSGPIIIGQAAEFDYAGTQACRALREEGVEVVLINSNPATIMTDGDIADKVYIEPLTVPVVKKLIMEEKPDSILPTLGGQNALNIAMALADEGFLEEHNVRTIGTNTDTIKLAEDRLEFKNLMERINEPCAASIVVNHVNDALEFAEKIGYPVVVRPAYTLGGTGGGIANNEKELHDICSNGLRLSRVSQCLIERCIAGWKEIEYEVMRDSAGNCITVCNMENLDPVGVHTGDSIVVAPSQTLSDKEYQMLRSSALNIINELNITGGCNVQYALHPESFEYCVIEVNPRVSRSSALASKATGYPIAKVAAKIALGYTLDEIKNAITKKTYASFEPTLDYCVVKIPRLPFDKFITASRKLTTQMKATGEVMSICNNFEGALMKAIRSLEQHVECLMDYNFSELTDDQLEDQLHVVDDRRIWVIAEALRRGVSYDKIHEITKIDKWFIDKIAIIVEMENSLKNEPLTPELLKVAKRIEFPDTVISRLTGKSEDEIKQMRYDNNIVASYKMVDTCAAEFEAAELYVPAVGLKQSAQWIDEEKFQAELTLEVSGLKELYKSQQENTASENGQLQMENSTWDGEVREAEAAENTTDEVDSENTECESESAVIDIEDIESEEYRKAEENAEGSDTETGQTQQSEQENQNEIREDKTRYFLTVYISEYFHCYHCWRQRSGPSLSSRPR